MILGKQKEHRAVALAFAPLLLAAAAASPFSLVVDPSIFEPDGCLAPAGGQPGCGGDEQPERRSLAPSASTALLAPDQLPDPAPARVLIPDLTGLVDHAPELSYRTSVALATNSEVSARCEPGARYRPGRAACVEPPQRSARQRAGNVKVNRAP
jgi:hypothetical protein